MTRTYEIQDRETHLILTFAQPIDQESDEVDQVNEQIMSDLEVTFLEQIDWRDDCTCWVWDEELV